MMRVWSEEIFNQFFLRVSLTFSRKQVITRVRRMRSEKEGGHEYDGE